MALEKKNTLRDTTKHLVNKANNPPLPKIKADKSKQEQNPQSVKTVWKDSEEECLEGCFSGGVWGVNSVVEGGGIL